MSSLNFPTIRDQAVATTREILNSIFNRLPKQEFDIRLWNGELIQAEGVQVRNCTLVLTHPGALRRMFFPPGELRLVEAYLNGDFDIEGDIVSVTDLGASLDGFTVTELLKLGQQVLTLPKTEPPIQYLDGRRPVQLHGRRQSRQRSLETTAYHYDVGNEFFRLFLGESMAYTCAYFQEATDELNPAQKAKFEHICRKLRLQPGERLLDIGCGWGGFVIYAAQNYGVEATGVTLSQAQAQYGQEWIEDVGIGSQAQIKFLDYRDVDLRTLYDKVVGIGIFEHVGRDYLSSYFQLAFAALRPGGLFFNHAIARQHQFNPNWFERHLLQRGQFLQRYVFPDGYLVPVSEALDLAEQAGFEVRDVESLRSHYTLTLRHWIHNLEANYEKALKLKDERTYRTFRLYMAASVWAFESAQVNIFQSLLSKNRDGVAAVPLTRADWYRPCQVPNKNNQPVSRLGSYVSHGLRVQKNE